MHHSKTIEEGIAKMAMDRERETENQQKLQLTGASTG
jgi:hypothetical protein